MNSYPRLRASCLLMAAAVLAQPACQDSTGVEKRTPTTLRILPASLTLDDGSSGSFSLSVLDQDGNVFTAPPAGLTIGWSSNAPSVASVAGGVVTANSPGETEVLASAGTLTARAAVTVLQVAAALAKVAGDEQSAVPGAALAQKVGVRVVDRHGDAVAGVPVEFAAADDGVVQPATVSSAADGLAETTWTLGPSEGAQSLTAAAAGVAEPVEFTATASALPVAKVVVMPDEAALMVGGELQLEAVMEDENGEPLQGRTVVWTSVDSAIAHVSATGMVSARAPGGPVFVIATSEGRADSAEITVIPPSVAAVEVSPATASIAAGRTVQLAATMRSIRGDTLSGRVVTWSSGDSLIARVSATGLVTGVAVGGPVSIVALSEGHRDSARVTVVAAPVAAVSVTPDSATIQEGGTVQLTATVMDAAGKTLPQRTVNWSSADSTVARVSGEGLVTGIARGGPLAVMAESEGRRDSAWVRVVDVPAALIVVAPDTATVEVGAERQLSATVYDSAGKVLVDRDVTWASSDTTIATVSTDGLVAARASGGPIAVSAAADGRSGMARVTVVKAALARLEFSPNSLFVHQSATGVYPYEIDVFAYDRAGRLLDMRGTPTVILVHALESTPGAALELVVEWEMVDPSIGTENLLRASVRSSYDASAAVAPVRRSGRARVRGLAQGSGNVELVVDGIGATIPFTVTDREFSAIRIDPPSASISQGSTLQLRAAIEDQDGETIGYSETSFEWTSANPVIATVSDSGIVSGLRPGIATVEASILNLRGSSEVTILDPTISRSDFVAISAGGAHACGISPQGTVFCWGQSSWGDAAANALGNEEGISWTDCRDFPARGCRPYALPVTGLPGPATSISAGGNHSCAIVEGGDLYCWGDNDYGQLGDGSIAGRLSPVLVEGMKFTAVSAGDDHTCALAAGGAAYCWGRNDTGQLGIGEGSEARATSPRAVANGADLGQIYRVISAGSLHTCGITEDGRAACWGRGGLLGDSSTANRFVPALIAAEVLFDAISAGGTLSCAVDTTGRRYCWGYRVDLTYEAPTPVPASDDLIWSSVSAGSFHACGATTDARQFCWGQNRNGELGNGTMEDRTVPMNSALEVTGQHLFTATATGGHFTCGLSGNETYCWGDGWLGQLGNHSFVGSSVPLLVTYEP